MGRRVRITIASALVTSVLAIPLARAYSVSADRGSTGTDTFEDQPLDHAAVPTGGIHVGSHGSALLTDTHGLLVAERNAGLVIRANRDGEAVARLKLHEGVAQLVSDGGGRVFAADRRGDRIVAVDASEPEVLQATGEVAIGEPYGLAMSPDGATLYATGVSDHELVAIDTQSLQVQWRVKLRAEPRGVAVSADGKEATVGFLSSAALAVVDLERKGKRVRWRTLNPRDHVEIEEQFDDWEGEFQAAVVSEARSRFQVPTDEGRREARNVFGVAYIGHGIAVAPHQLSTPQMKRVPSSEMQDSYGGGPEAIPAIVHRLALVDAPSSERSKTSFAHLALHQPRALTYDDKTDTLYLAGYGDDRVLALADASQSSAYVAWTVIPKDNPRSEACGPDGVVLEGEHLWVHCELSRKLLRLTASEFDLDDSSWVREKAGVYAGPELAASLRSEEVERGAELFRRGGDWTISDSGVMACASCHPDGRQDGLSWRLGGSILQTPMLAGRVQGTAPYKWSGADENLSASFRHTIERLGGQPDQLSAKDYRALEAYVLSVPRPNPPTATDSKAIARGRKLFNGDLDCISCHNGDKLTDGAQYPFDSRGLDTTDTPSLLGLAHTAPYYHDGSAKDLYALLTDKGNVHDMADVSGLKKSEIADLITYLHSL